MTAAVTAELGRAAHRRAISLPRVDRLTLALSATLFAWLSVLAFLLPYDPDEAVFKIVATGIFDGQWPYRDLFDHKPPAIYAWYIPAGLGASIEFQRVFAALMLGISVPVFRAAAARWLEGRELALAVVAYVLFLATPHLAILAHTEAFMLLPLVGAAAVGSPLIAGALLGLAVMTKPSAVFFAPFLFVVWKRQSWKVVAGVAAACAAFALPFAPIWRDFWDANVTFNVQYGGDVSLSDRIDRFFNLNRTVVLGSLVLWLAALGGLLFERRPAVWIWLAGALLAVKLTSYEFAHYYGLLAPPLALLAGIGIERLVVQRRVLAVRFPARLIAAICVVFAVTIGGAGIWYSLDPPFEDVAAAIRERDGEFYMLGGHAHIYAMADREPERRFFFSVPLIFNETWGVEAREALEMCPPDVLVVTVADVFELEWADQMGGLYAQSHAFEGSTMYTEPHTPPCPRGER